MADNLYSAMYGGDIYRGRDAKVPAKPAAVSKEKMAARVMGGMKAQGSHTITVEIDGELHNLPRPEYVAQLEAQVKELKAQVRDNKTKLDRLVKANNRIMNLIRELQNDMTTKVDYRP
jgi:hypothetical protein